MIDLNYCTSSAFAWVESEGEKNEKLEVFVLCSDALFLKCEGYADFPLYVV